VALLARSAGSLFAAFGLLAALAVLFALAVFAAFAVLFAIAAFTAFTAFTALWCAHRFVPEVRALVLCNCDATGKCGSQREGSARKYRGDREGFAVIHQCGWCRRSVGVGFGSRVVVAVLECCHVCHALSCSV
jgi:hypothetical protein